MATSATFTETFIAEFMDRLVSAWNEGDLDGFMAMLTDDVVMTDPGLAEPVRGNAEVRAVFEAFRRAFPDLRTDAYTIHVALDGSPRLLNHWLMSGTFTAPLDPPGLAPTGTLVELEGASRMHFRDGLVSEYHFIYDLMGFGRQVGAAPKPGSLTERIGFVMQRRTARRLHRRIRG